MILSADKNTAALNAVDLIDRYDVGFMHADKMLFGQGILHLFHVLQGDDALGRGEYRDVIFQSFNKQNIIQVHLLDLMLCFYKNKIAQKIILRQQLLLLFRFWLMAE